MCDINFYCEQSVCFTCLSSNRKLTPLGNLSYVFLEICNYLITIPPDEMNICWECSAVLKRISHFKEKAFKAQEILSECNFESQTAAQKSLSNLTATQVNNEITIAHAEVKTEEKFELDEFKVNDQFDTSEGSRLIPNIKIELEVDDDDKDNYQIDFDNGDFPYGLKLEDIKNEIANTSEGDVKEKEKEEKGRKVNKKKYRFISIKKDIGTLVKDVEIDKKDIHESAVLERDNEMFKSLPYKCKTCPCAWKERVRMLKHNKRCHSVNAGKFMCDICSSRFRSEELLAQHSQRHKFRRKCVICGFECFSMCVMREHLITHKKMRRCVDCDEFFSDWVVFKDHYRRVHSTRICDYCGKRFTSLLTIERHIKREHLSSHHCTICDKQYKHDRALKNHQIIFHVKKRDESTYCVQCDMQFDNVQLYRRHVRSTVAHADERKVRKRYKPASCPVCAKVYARKTYMMNHYNKVHVKKTRYYCEECDKYFLTSYHYKNHMDYTHKGLERKRNKLCTFCGRGFSSNKILTNHIRTHTGERPYECSYCSAKFAQSYALKTHEKHIHLKIKRKDK